MMEAARLMAVEWVWGSRGLTRAMELKTHISVEVDLSDAIRMLNDRERVEWASALLETISEEGTIGVMRDLVNNSQWDDQSPNCDSTTDKP